MTDKETRTKLTQNEKLIVEAITARMELIMDAKLETIRQEMKTGRSSSRGQTIGQVTNHREPRRMPQDEATDDYYSHSSHRSHRKERPTLQQGSLISLNLNSNQGMYSNQYGYRREEKPAEVPKPVNRPKAEVQVHTTTLIPFTPQEVLKDIPLMPQEVLKDELTHQHKETRFKDMFPKERPKGWPPNRGTELQVDVIPETTLPNWPAYRTSPLDNIPRDVDNPPGVLIQVYKAERARAKDLPPKDIQVVTKDDPDTHKAKDILPVPSGVPKLNVCFDINEILNVSMENKTIAVKNQITIPFDRGKLSKQVTEKMVQDDEETIRKINDSAYTLDLQGKYPISSGFNVTDLVPFVADETDLRANPFEEGGDDMSTAGSKEDSIETATGVQARKLSQAIELLMRSPSKVEATSKTVLSVIQAVA